MDHAANLIAGRSVWVIGVLCTLSIAGCAFGPRVLENSHPRYNESVKEVVEQESLLNLVRLRYNDIPQRLDISAIADQHELSSSLEARPFFSTEATGNLFRSFTRILPFADISEASRPTITLSPLDDADTVRRLFRPGTLDSVIFLSETSWPVSTIFRLWVQSLNGLPNAVTATGPTREVVPEYDPFSRAVELLEALHERREASFVVEEKLTQVGSPVPGAKVTAADLIEAGKNGYEYLERPGGTWELIRRDRRLVLAISPQATASPEAIELCQLLHLVPGLTRYELIVGSTEAPCLSPEAPLATTISLSPRSTVQVLFYLSHGIIVPPEHIQEGVLTATREPDGRLFDWQQVLQGLFTVHYAKQHFRPPQAFVAVKYRGYWFYIDDRDPASKSTFLLVQQMARVDLVGVRKGAPVLTLPIGR